MQPSEARYIPEKRPTNLARSPPLVGPRRKKTDRGQISRFPSDASRFTPLILAHRGSALPWLVDDRAALRPRRMYITTAKQVNRGGALLRTPPQLSQFRLFKKGITHEEGGARQRGQSPVPNGHAPLNSHPYPTQINQGCMPVMCVIF